MKTRTFRWIIAIGTLSIVSILATQIFWVMQAYKIRENTFNETVTQALNRVSNQIFAFSNTTPPVESPIKQFQSNYYLVMVNSPLDANLLDYLLKKEFKEENILIDFEYGIYNCDTEDMVYGDYIHNQMLVNPVKQSSLPVWGEENYYFGVLFPSKTGYIINHMDTWVFTSVLMLIMTGFFGYALVIILRQRRLSEVQKDFINNMTHEFKTPISTISVSTEVLKKPEIVHDPDRLHHYAHIIENENNRLKKQVDRVLQMALLDKDKVTLKHERVDMHEIIERMVDTHTISSPEVEFKLLLDATSKVVSGDPLHLSNIMYNLVDNAIKYGGKPPMVTIHTNNDDERLIVSISDNGCGVPKEFQRKIFHRFFRIPTGNVHNVKGFGLGLHYVQYMVKAHLGSIALDSTESGSKFKISFPHDKRSGNTIG